MINVVTVDALELANDLRPVVLRLGRELRKETDQFGVTGRQATLLWLVREQPGLSLRELAAQEGISAPALSGHVDRLERLGLIERVRSDDDRRRVGLALTPEGARLLRRLREHRTAWLAARLGQLEPEQLERIAAALEPLRRLAVTAAVLALQQRTFRSLRRHRNYRLFFLGQAFSVSGSWMQNIALAWLVVELTQLAARGRRARVLPLPPVHRASGSSPAG